MNKQNRTRQLQHIALLLETHDGDDRCGCLANAVWEQAFNTRSPGRVIDALSNCRLRGVRRRVT